MGITFVTLNDLEIFQNFEKKFLEVTKLMNEAVITYRDLAPVIQEFTRLVEHNQKLLTRLEKSITKIEKLETGDWS